MLAEDPLYHWLKTPPPWQTVGERPPRTPGGLRDVYHATHTIHINLPPITGAQRVLLTLSSPFGTRWVRFPSPPGFCCGLLQFPGLWGTNRLWKRTGAASLLLPTFAGPPEWVGPLCRGVCGGRNIAAAGSPLLFLLCTSEGSAAL